MRRFILIVFTILFTVTPGYDLFPGVLINEIACETSGDDWVELFFYSAEDSSIDISTLYVTMYYGTNEALSADHITLYSYDRPETPYDDRFAVIHLTGPSIPDETDLTGDTNHNGCIDVYCNNYTGSLWNSDGVVAIDTDDDPSNGGIIDFAAYSNRDGSPNETITSYVEDALLYNQWANPGGDIQQCMADIGPEGLSPYMSIIRKSTSDQNSADDFIITSMQTPGRENISGGASSGGKKLFTLKKKKITIIPSHASLGSGDINVIINEPCNIRFRIFSTLGQLLYESPLYKNVFPGGFLLPWDLKLKHRDACTGLYLGYIEATGTSRRISETEIIYLIVSHYR